MVKTSFTWDSFITNFHQLVTQFQLHLLLASRPSVRVHSLGRSFSSVSFWLRRRFSCIRLSLSPSLFSFDSSQEWIHSSIVMDSERSVLTDHSNRDVLICQIHLIRQGVPQGSQSAFDQFVQITFLELWKELL